MFCKVYDYLLIPLIENQHPSELENVRTLKNLHNLEVDRIKAEFHKSLENLKNQQHSKLNDARTEQSEKESEIPKPPISSE